MTSTVISTETNPRGIPKAVFIVRYLSSSPFLSLTPLFLRISRQESVPTFLGGPEGDAELGLKSLEESLAFVSSLPSLFPSLLP